MLELMTNWFTPTSLFVLLNLVIGTIWLTSLFSTHKRQHQFDDPYLTRPRSFNYNSHSDDFTYAQPQPLVTRAPSLLNRVKSLSFKNLHFPSEPADPVIETGHHQVISAEFHQVAHFRSEPEQEMDRNPEPEQQVKRSESDGGYSLRRGAERMVRSASEKNAGFEKSEAVERRRPATARVERTTSIGADVEVDVRADDFINRFKQQLKLQRLDSLLRYQEMITRGASR